MRGNGTAFTAGAGRAAGTGLGEVTPRTGCGGSGSGRRGGGGSGGERERAGALADGALPAVKVAARAAIAATAKLQIACILSNFALSHSSSSKGAKRRLFGGVGESSNTIVGSVVSAAAESGTVCAHEGNAVSGCTAARVSELSDASTICSERCGDSDESRECTSANC